MCCNNNYNSYNDYNRYNDCNGDAEGYGRGYGNDGILQFLRTLVPGTCIVIQYDSQRPVRAVFQGLRRRTLLVSDLQGFPRTSGFTHIAISRINAVSIHSNCPRNWDDCDNE
ncbi:hypothetical protein [Bacillus mycoides]|uniref:hypothetical protein n=1 Tax=Bacillus mycoides TaxID=1405 RepID=UPI00273B613B|nr:hypothetical protein [Bacillus mycoides]